MEMTDEHIKRYLRGSRTSSLSLEEHRRKIQMIRTHSERATIILEAFLMTIMHVLFSLFGPQIKFTNWETTTNVHKEQVINISLKIIPTSEEVQGLLEVIGPISLLLLCVLFAFFIICSIYEARTARFGLKGLISRFLCRLTLAIVMLGTFMIAATWKSYAVIVFFALPIWGSRYYGLFFGSIIVFLFSVVLFKFLFDVSKFVCRRLNLMIDPEAKEALFDVIDQWTMSN